MDCHVETRIDAYVDEVWEDVVADIAALVSHPSVADAAAARPGAPFGAPARNALDCALGIAVKLGYEVSDDEGYVGIADIPGERSEQVATIAHVDVVPASPGWASDPFAMERREGWLLGRGVIDDKGPAVLSLYAGAFLLRAGMRPRYTFRALLGCDEEVGMSDVHHYRAHHDDPAFLFTPDAEFPVCNAEKGCFEGTFASAPIVGGAIRSWSGAEAGNAIPSESVVELGIAADQLPAPQAQADRLHIEATPDGGSRVVAHGIGGHASLPAGTVNAVGLVVTYLREVVAAMPECFCAAERDALEMLAVVHADTAGERLGIASENEAFGALTCNAGVIAVADGRLEQTIDVRFPDSTTVGALTLACQACAERFGGTFEPGRTKQPFSTPADSPAVQALLDTYREVTGREAAPFSMGGGTYARNFGRAVSFGPEDNSLELPAWAGAMHGPNEAANEAQLKEALKIYILAILRLMELEL